MRRGPKSSYPIELSSSEEKDLRHLVRAHTTGQALVVRARIVLTTHEHPEWENQRIAQTVGTSDRMVRKWRGRWVATRRLTDAPRSGAPRRFSPEVRSQVTATACTLPRQTGVPLARWSRAEVARKVVAKLSGQAPSASTIGRWLKAERLRPWRYHSWQHIHDPKRFLERAHPALQLYARAQSLWREGTWLLCLDEKTSIQAREGQQPPRPAQNGRPELREAHYQRRGARHLFAGLSVADGQVYGSCRARKTFADFQAFVQQVIIPQALERGTRTVCLILDNGTTHAPKQLECWLQEQPAVVQGQLTFHVCWLPPNASWLDQLEIWFSILQRKLLQPNHFVNVQDLEQAIADFLMYYNQQAKPIKWTYTVEQLEDKLGIHLR